MTSWTRRRVTAATWGSSLSTRDAVRMLTPAACATSRRMLCPLTPPPSSFAIDGKLQCVSLCHRWQVLGPRHSQRRHDALHEHVRREIGSYRQMRNRRGGGQTRQLRQVRTLVKQFGLVPYRPARAKPAHDLGGLQEQPDEKGYASSRHQPGP